MKIVETIAEVRAQVKEWRAQGLSVGHCADHGIFA